MAVGHGAAVAPGDLAWHARCGGEAADDRLGCGAWAYAAAIVPDQREPAVPSARFQALAQHQGRALRGDSSPALAVVCAGSERTGSADPGARGIGIVAGLVHGVSAQAPGGRARAHGESVMGPAVEVKAGTAVKHPRRLESGGCSAGEGPDHPGAWARVSAVRRRRPRRVCQAVRGRARGDHRRRCGAWRADHGGPRGRHRAGSAAASSFYRSRRRRDRCGLPPRRDTPRASRRVGADSARSHPGSSDARGRRSSR